ncbi:MAG: ATP-binding protein [Planctomycetaceae bacterium]|nr:ATP-binding protein [Planctomycetaceae bacterium]
MPNVSRQDLNALLEEGHEHERLDYKEMFKPDEKRSWVELAKDVGAMLIEGGHLVFGVDGNGRPTGNFTADQSRKLDEATVRSKLRRWIPDPFEVSTAIHEINGHIVSLMYITPHPDGFCIFKEDGVFEDNSIIFRKGEVFSRHGSASERWQQLDIIKIKRNLLKRQESIDLAHVYKLAIPRTMNIAGAANELVSSLIRHFDPPCDEGVLAKLTEEYLANLCAQVNPKTKGPMINRVDFSNGHVFGTWLDFFRNCRQRSKTFTADMDVYSRFLEPIHISLLAQVEQCSYFRMLDNMGDLVLTVPDFSSFSSSIWEYWCLTRELKEYAEAKKLEWNM